MNLDDSFFQGAPSVWTLPLTERAGSSVPHWRQREYVTCMQCGFSFAAHRDGDVGELWHYKLPTPLGWAYLTVKNPWSTEPRGIANHSGNPFLPKTP